MFRLHLNGENTWHITATEGRHALVQELARVMELEPADGSEDGSQLVFTGPNGISSLISTGNGNARLVYEDARLRLWWLADRQDVICEVPAEIAGDDVYHTLRMVVQIIHHHNVLRGGLTLHAALVEFKGRGVLLAAKGGSGKTTCCRRLPDNWRTWCDDETLVARDAPRGYVAHPFPTWSHYLDEEGVKTWFTEIAIPLSAVFFLEQGEDDGVAPLPAFEAAMWLYHSVYPVYQRKFGKPLKAEEKQSFNTRLFNNACDIALSVPAYRLRISLNGQFWEAIEDILGAEKT
jgi:SynChlorMet cassette protein ScmC